MLKHLIGCLLFISLAGNLRAVEGFKNFRFGDSYRVVSEKGQGQCEFAKPVKDSRWTWLTAVECQNFFFKEGVRVKLYFLFSDDRLIQINVVSRDIPNYPLIRQVGRHYDYLLPIAKAKAEKPISNLADKLIFQDQVHLLEPGHRYTTFFYQGTWEWEFWLADVDALARNQERERETIEEEQQKGLKGWNRFIFGDSADIIKEKLEGLCSETRISSDLDQRKTILCKQFPFVEVKIEAHFFLVQDELVKIELRFPAEWYEALRDQLKRKYGLPYRELEENGIYYPYIEFPEKNVLLLHYWGSPDRTAIGVTLIYYREGFKDFGLTESVGKGVEEPFKRPKSTADKILENL